MLAMSLRRSSRVAAAAASSAPAHSPSRSLSPLSSASDDNPRPTKRARVDKPTKSSGSRAPRKAAGAKRAKAEPAPGDFAPRAANAWKIGPHVSSAGGVENAIVNAASVGYVHPIHGSRVVCIQAAQGERICNLPQVSAQVGVPAPEGEFR